MSGVYEGVDGYEEFADQQLGRLLRYAVMLTGERELAADLVQDVLVKVFRQWPRIAAAERPERYVLRMVTNEHVSWRRRWAVRTIVPMRDLPESIDEPDLQTTYATHDEMWRRLETLPKRQRAVLVLRYYEQLNDAEIAEVLGCSPTTVRGYAHRALTALRADLAADSSTRAEEIR